MKRINIMVLALACIFSVSFLTPSVVMAADPIIVGVPTSLGQPSGAEGLNSVIMAVEEINARGGVNVGGTMRKYKVESMDIRDASPGVPVPDALLGLEKIILDKKVHAILVGPFRSEALLAGMDIIAKYKVPMLGTIAMTPATEAKIKKEPEKYKYIFRSGLNVIFFVKHQMGFYANLKKTYGFNKVFIIHQDVLWARGSAKGFGGILKKQGWTVSGVEAYPTGATDFSAALMKARATGAQTLLPIFDMPTSGILVKQWKAMKIPALMAGIIVPLAGSEAWEGFDKKISGAINAVFEIGNIPVSKHPLSLDYYSKYEKRWGKTVQEQHGPAPSYETPYILKTAIERAGSLDADAIVAALEKTDHMGCYGRIKFGPTHQAIFTNDPATGGTSAQIQWREGGRRAVVYPASVASDRIELPAGLKIGK